MVHSNSSVLFTVSIPVWCVFAHWRGDNALIQEARKRWGRRQWVNLKSRGGRSSQFVWWLQSFMTEQPDVFNFFARQSDKLELWYDGKKDCANNIFFLQNSQTGYIIETTSLFTIYIYIMFVLEYWKMHLAVQVYHNLLQINTKKIWNCI